MKTKSITKVTLLSIFVTSVITAVTLNSCQKEAIKPKIVNSTGKQTSATTLASTSAQVISDINNLILPMRKNQKGLVPGGIDTVGCVTITIDTIDKPNTITYNYGSSCTGGDGKTRSGVIVLNYADPDIRVVNNVVTATMQNYTVNGKLLNGVVGVTNIGTNGHGNLVLVEAGAISSLSANQINPDSITMNYNYEWIAGESSSPAANWQFSVTGGWTSSYTLGQRDSFVITTPLIKNAKNAGCSYYIQGTSYSVSTAPSGPVYQYTDYSTPGGCSGQYSVTQNGVTTVEQQ